MAEATLQRPPGLPPWWRDLNMFVALFAAIVSFASFAVFIPLSLVLKLVLPAPQAEMFAWPLGYAVVALGLGWRWWKHGLSPRQVHPARAGRFRAGHALLAIFNIAMTTMILGSSLGAYSLIPRMPGVAVVLGAFMSFAPMAVLVGLALVWSARGSPTAFAATLPAGAAAPRQKPSAKWPNESTQARSAPSKLVVLAGLVASSFLLFVAGVFAALGFSHNQEAFSNVFLPIAVGVYAVYVMTTVGLMARRHSATHWVAWSPVVLLTVVLPAVQMLAMFVR